MPFRGVNELGALEVEISFVFVVINHNLINALDFRVSN